MEPKVIWEKRAACKDSDTEIYFPERNIKLIDYSKRSCNICPVQGNCMTYAIAHDEYGMWGGTTRAERKNMGREFTEAIREVYYIARLLEFRPGEIEYFLKQKQEQSKERQVPIASLDHDLDPIEDPYSQAS